MAKDQVFFSSFFWTRPLVDNFPFPVTFHTKRVEINKMCLQPLDTGIPLCPVYDHATARILCATVHAPNHGKGRSEWMGKLSELMILLKMCKIPSV